MRDGDRFHLGGRTPWNNWVSAARSLASGRESVSEIFPTYVTGGENHELVRPARARDGVYQNPLNPAERHRAGADADRKAKDGNPGEGGGLSKLP